MEHHGPKYTFIYECNYEDQPKYKIVSSIEGEGLGDVITAFEDFLKAAGFPYVELEAKHETR